MKKTVTSLRLMILFALATAASGISQTQPEAASAPSASQIQAGTQIKAQLESTLDARTAKPGEEVKARVTQDVKQDGRTVIRKGDRLLGRVKSAEAAGKADSASSMAVEFDRLVQGRSTSSLHTVVSAVLSTPAEERAESERIASEPIRRPASPPPSPARSGGSASGGLLGGATSTVDSTIGASGSVLGGVGGTLDATAQSTVGSAAGISLGTPAKAIRVGSEGQASQSGNLTSVLRTDQGRLRLDSGTTLEFRVASQGQAQANPSPQ